MQKSHLEGKGKKSNFDSSLQIFQLFRMCCNVTNEKKKQQ